MPYTPETPAAIARRIATRVVARTQLTDLRPSSEALQLVQAVSEEIATLQRAVARVRDARNPGRARGRDLVDLAAEYGIAIPGPTRATLYLRFSRDDTSGAVVVPKDTVCWTGDGQGYQTTASVTMLAGEAESTSVLAVALTEGEAGNAAVGTVTKVSGLPGGVRVTNVTAATDGRAGASVAEIRQLLRDYPRTVSRCNRTAIERKALEARLATGQQVRFARRVFTAEPSVAILYVDDGAGGLQASYSAAPAETLTASAVGGEFVFYTQRRPIRTKPTVYRDGVALVEGVDYTISRPHGQIHLFASAAAGEEYTTGPYSHWTGLVAEVNRLLYDDPRDFVSTPDHVALGGVVLVEGAKVQVPQFTMQVLAREGYAYETAAADARSAVVALINRLGIGEPLRDSAVHAAALGVASRSVLDVDLPDWTDFYPAADTVLRATPDDIAVVSGGA